MQFGDDVGDALALLVVGSGVAALVVAAAAVGLLFETLLLEETLLVFAPVFDETFSTLAVLCVAEGVAVAGVTVVFEPVPTTSLVIHVQTPFSQPQIPPLEELVADALGLADAEVPEPDPEPNPLDVVLLVVAGAVVFAV